HHGRVRPAARADAGAAEAEAERRARLVHAIDSGQVTAKARMKDEGGRMKARLSGSCFPFILPTSSFLLHPYFLPCTCSKSQGETRMAGTRRPSRSKAKAGMPFCGIAWPLMPSGLTAFGGATWS